MSLIGSMESLVGNRLHADVVHLNNHKTSILTPKPQFPPFLAKLLLQENNSLTRLPPSFFQHIPVFRVLDLSHTSIQFLPPSISKLCSLEEFTLRECSLLIELPPEIGALRSLKLFDLEGTEIMYLPKEIGNLRSLERLRISFSTYAKDHKETNGIQHIIPRMTILKLSKLKELSINVSPEAEWWEVELLEAIMGDLVFLPDLKTLKLYLPTAKALQQFLSLERYEVPVYSSLWNYRFMTGHCEQLPFSVQVDSEENFLKLEKCVKYMNGEGYSDEIVELVRYARALYLRRHWTIEKLSMFDIGRFKYCLLMECNEMQTLVDQEDGEDSILGSLQYLSIHFLKKLQRISKGPIGRNNLSCLRILAFHTCPELTSIFTACLLDNLQSLTEIIVEDCPKVKCLVNLEEGPTWSNGPFLLNFRKISLLDLPELVSVSGGVCIAPQLDTLLVFNCMKLDSLSVMEIPRDIMAIKGEIEWWDALKSGKSTWESAFVELKRDGSLMDQLAEDTNSLQHFLKLEMIHSLPGQVNQNSSMDTKEGREHADQLQINHNVDLSNKAQKMSNQEPSDDTYIWRQHLQFMVASRFRRKQTDVSIITSNHKVKVSKSIDVEKALDDGYIWKKYGQKDILGSKYPRAYYRCSFGSTHDCCAKKQVQRSDEDPSVFEVTYRGKHTCPTVLSSTLHVNQNSKDTKEDMEPVDQLQIVHNVDLSNETRKISTVKILNCNNGTQSQYGGAAFRMWDPSSPVGGKPDDKDTNCISKAPNHKLASKKKKCRSADIAKWIQQVKGDPNDARKNLQNESLNSKYPSSVSSITSRFQVKVNKVKKGIEVGKALNDGYIWRKYGEKPCRGTKYPRAYYKCSFRGCCARKHVERSTKDPSVFKATYSGKHTCPTVSSNNCSSTATESACTTLRPKDASSAIESASVITDSDFEIPKWPQMLESNKKKSSGIRDAKWTQLLKVRPGDLSTATESASVISITDSDFDVAKWPQLLESNKKEYYRCNGCDAKNLVQGSDDDTYKGIHTCLRLSACESESSLSILKNSDPLSTTESEVRSLKNSGSSATTEAASTIIDNSSGVNFTKKMSDSDSILRRKQQMDQLPSKA